MTSVQIETKTDDLDINLAKKILIKATQELSYYEAAEGEQWRKERLNRDMARITFNIWRDALAKKIGNLETLMVINSVPNLLWNDVRCLLPSNDMDVFGYSALIKAQRTATNV